MVQDVQIVQVVQVVKVVKVVSLDDMYSENIWFGWSNPSDYSEKLICHTCDRQTHIGKISILLRQSSQHLQLYK